MVPSPVEKASSATSICGTTKSKIKNQKSKRKQKHQKPTPVKQNTIRQQHKSMVKTKQNETKPEKKMRVILMRRKNVYIDVALKQQFQIELSFESEF